ncbi:MAG: hypothetical protein ACRD2E_09540 [Terriglobales bacterium]
MIRLVESPPGHLSGFLTIPALKKDGSRKRDSTHDLAGSITGANVSLQVGGGLIGLAHHWLGASRPRLIGSLAGGTLALSSGDGAWTFKEVSLRRYQKALARLNEAGRHIGTVYRARTAVLETAAYQRELNADLEAYPKLGHARINEAPTVYQWYVYRITRYGECLRNVRRLAAAGVPKWRWQSCVLHMENDKYARDQVDQSLRQRPAQNRQAVADLNARIVEARRRFSAAVRSLDSACPYINDAGECRRAVKEASTRTPDGFLSGSLIVGYTRFAPQVSRALNAEALTASRGEATLSAISQRAVRLLWESR